MPDPVSPYTPTLADVPRIAEVFALAMAEDPLHVYFVPEERRRADVLRAMYGMIALAGVRARLIHASSPAIEGVMLWESDQRHELTAGGMARAGAWSLPWRVGILAILRMVRSELWSQKLRLRLAPKGCAHLAILAVHPDHQGKGWAGRLIRPALAPLDAAGTSCCLETENPRNVPLYEHFGFKVVCPTRIPRSQVEHWLMVRPPAPRGPEATGR